jgi:hypothetical protein
VQVEKCFKREFINRLSEIVTFDPLSHDELRDIVRIHMKTVIATVADNGVSLFASDTALDIIRSKSHDDVCICYLKIIDLMCSCFYVLVMIYSLTLIGVWHKAYKEMDQEKCDDRSCKHVGEWRSP